MVFRLLAATLPLPCLNDLEATAIYLGPVEGVDRCPGSVGVIHLNESESAGTTGFPIHDHLCR